MENLFVYGTLKDTSLRKRLTGRNIDSVKDKLHGYKRVYTNIDGKRYSIIIAHGNLVLGELLEITKKELKILDEYETNSYRRKKVTLDSGTKAWVYLR
jgi:gamma-glutamylcyclotransferase (GGCT)/AIG2-like uncharacterized protein YtfP